VKNVNARWISRVLDACERLGLFLLALGVGLTRALDLLTDAAQRLVELRRVLVPPLHQRLERHGGLPLPRPGQRSDLVAQRGQL
jgi:hypothetical protein